MAQLQIKLILAGLLLLVGVSCRKHPDWTDRPRDPRLVGEWRSLRHPDYDFASYIFFETGVAESPDRHGSGGQYYTKGDTLFTYIKGNFKVAMQELNFLYRIHGDTLILTALTSHIEGEVSRYVRESAWRASNK